MRSSAADGEHSGPVWAVRWQPAMAAGPRSLVFVSISSDGRLVEWALGKARMTHEVCLYSTILPVIFILRCDQPCSRKWLGMAQHSNKEVASPPLPPPGTLSIQPLFSLRLTLS